MPRIAFDPKKSKAIRIKMTLNGLARALAAAQRGARMSCHEMSRDFVIKELVVSISCSYEELTNFFRDVGRHMP